MVAKTLCIVSSFGQWRLQKFSLGCSYFTLKKFQVISVYFGTFQQILAKIQDLTGIKFVLKKKKKIVLKTKTNLHSIHQKISKGRKKKINNVVYIPLIGCLF